MDRATMDRERVDVRGERYVMFSMTPVCSPSPDWRRSSQVVYRADSPEGRPVYICVLAGDSEDESKGADIVGPIREWEAWDSWNESGKGFRAPLADAFPGRTREELDAMAAAALNR